MITDQYLRKASLIVAGNDTAIELADLRFHFSVSQSDIETPNNALIRVYNLSEATARNLAESKEFTRVILQAGYETGNFGTIFDGSIKQFRRGRENPTDTYFDIIAADADALYNFGVVNTTLAAGSTKEQQAAAIAKSIGADIGSVPQFGGNQLPRGKVMFGMARDQFRKLADSSFSTWSFQNGKLVMIPQTSYLPGEAVVLTELTGMVGIPEQTNDGIRVKCLLNPKIQIGTQIQLNNAEINTHQIGGFGLFSGIDQPPPLNADGFYKVLVVEHEGDTRDNAWYSNLTCISINKSVDPGTSVNPFSTK